METLRRSSVVQLRCPTSIDRGWPASWRDQLCAVRRRCVRGSSAVVSTALWSQFHRQREVGEVCFWSWWGLLLRLVRSACKVGEVCLWGLLLKLVRSAFEVGDVRLWVCEVCEVCLWGWWGLLVRSTFEVGEVCLWGWWGLLVRSTFEVGEVCLWGWWGLLVRLVKSACEFGEVCLWGWRGLLFKLVRSAFEVGEVCLWGGEVCLWGWRSLLVSLVKSACEVGEVCLWGWWSLLVSLVKSACEVGEVYFWSWWGLLVRLVSSAGEAHFVYYSIPTIVYTVSTHSYINHKHMGEFYKWHCIERTHTRSHTQVGSICDASSVLRYWQSYWYCLAHSRNPCPALDKCHRNPVVDEIVSVPLVSLSYFGLLPCCRGYIRSAMCGRVGCIVIGGFCTFLDRLTGIVAWWNFFCYVLCLVGLIGCLICLVVILWRRHVFCQACRLEFCDGWLGWMVGRGWVLVFGG